MARKVKEALRILAELGMPRAQQNERSALCLLAICDLEPKDKWADANAPLIGITPIIEFAAKHYMDEPYAPNTRETIRRQSMHQFCDAGIALYNPDDPRRPVNSPKAVYQLSPEALSLMRAFGSDKWREALALFKTQRRSLVERYARARDMAHIPLKLTNGRTVKLSPGDHSQLIRQVVEVFGPHYAPGAELIYAGDTGNKWSYFDSDRLASLGVQIDSHGKMPSPCKELATALRDSDHAWAG